MPVSVAPSVCLLLFHNCVISLKFTLISSTDISLLRNLSKQNDCEGFSTAVKIKDVLVRQL